MPTVPDVKKTAVPGKRAGGFSHRLEMKSRSLSRISERAISARIWPRRHVSIRNTTAMASSNGNHPPSNNLIEFATKKMRSMIRKVDARSLLLDHSGVEYRLKPVVGSCRQLIDGTIRLVPNDQGELILKLDVSGVRAGATITR